MAISITITKNTFRAGSQFADVDPHHVAAEAGYPRIVASGYTGALTPSDDGAGGTFEAVNAFTWDYIPKNETKNIIIKVTDTVPNFDTEPLAVTGTFPIQPNFGYSWKPQTFSKAVFAKDNSPRFRRVRKRGYGWELSFLNRMIADVSVVEAFFEFHDIDIEFYYIDVELAIEQLVRFDSAAEWSVNNANNFEAKLLLKAHSATAITIPEVYT